MPKSKRILSLMIGCVLIFSLVAALAPSAKAASKIYYPIDFTQAVLDSRINQKVSGDCAVTSMATIEAYLHGAVTEEEKNIVYNALIEANGDNDYAYWGNVGYKTSQNSIDWENVYNQIAQGYPCIIHRPANGSSPQHWSVVAGYQGSSSILEPDQFILVEVNHTAGAGIQTVGEWRGAAVVDRYTWRDGGMAISGLIGIRFAINHPPVIKETGIAHSVKGTILSDSNLTRLQIRITDLNNGKDLFSRNLTPNIPTYAISNLDSEMAYSSWPEGTYYFTIYAQNAAGQEAMYGTYFEIRPSYPDQKPNPTYTFSFTGGDGAMEPITVGFGHAIALPACTLTRAGAEILGWQVQRADGTWLTDRGQWLTDSQLKSENADRDLLPDGFQGILDAWWIRDALNLCDYTLVALWDIEAPDAPTEPEPTEPEPTEPKPTEPEPTEPEPTEPEPTEPETPIPSDVHRVFGNHRYETAFAIADALKDYLKVDTFDTIVIASGTNFADALSGSYLAAMENAPILITDGKNGEELKAYIDANLTPGGTVYILGGPAAVPDQIQHILEEAGFSPVRLAGAGRYETNLAILEEAGILSIQDILICSGTNFPDALCASAVGLPILLVGDELTDDQTAFLLTTSRRFFLIGGNAVISQEIESALNQIGTCERISGPGRYETAVAVADRFFLAPSSAVLAFGKAFPDGLCGGPLAYAIGAPLILTESGQEHTAATYCADNGITAGIALGGSAVLSDASIRQVFSLEDHSSIQLYGH